MKKNFLRLAVLCLISMGCSSDDSNGVTVGGPSGGNDDDGGVSGDPLLYIPTTSLQDLANFPIGILCQRDV